MTLQKSELLRRERIENNARINPNYGMKGKQHSLKSKEKMSESWDYDLHFNKEIRKKISNSLKGRMPKNIEQLKKINIGRKFSKEHREKLSKAQKKRFILNPVSEETRKKLRERMLKNPIKYWLGKGHEMIGKMPFGENHFNWQGGKSFEPYGPEFNIKLKNEIKEGDRNKCKLCERKVNLAIHHIDYNKKNNSKENLVTLCFRCNSIVNFSREKWTNYFKNAKKTKQGAEA